MPGKRPRAAKTSTPSIEVGPIPFVLDRIGLRKLSYDEVETNTPVTPVTLGSRMSVDLRMEMRLTIAEEGFELYVEAQASPDPGHLPFTVQVGLSAFFKPLTGMDRQEILDFATGPAVRIVFPYLREVISTTSMRGLFGPLWLDPLAIGVVNLKAAELSRPGP